MFAKFYLIFILLNIYHTKPFNEQDLMKVEMYCHHIKIMLFDYTLGKLRALNVKDI